MKTLMLSTAVILFLQVAIPAVGQDASAPDSPDTSNSIDEKPLIDAERFLTGDWGGRRSELAADGLTFDLIFTQSFQGVARGGKDTGFKYGGTLDYGIKLNLDQMGVLPGAFVSILAESRYGESVNSTAAGLLPVNADMFFPLTEESDENVPITVTELAYTQFLSPQFGVLLGKFQTLNGDPNEFASGRGVSQFMSLSLISPNLLGTTVPYSTLGAGIVVLPNEYITVTSLLMNTTDSSTTTGFDDIGDGTSWNTEAWFQYRLGELPGGQNLGVTYAFDNEFLNFKTFSPSLIDLLFLETESESWAVYWSAWQYVWLLEEAPRLIDPGDGRADARGLGLFARLNFADKETNPFDWTATAGVGGRGLIPTREEDQFGIGAGYGNETVDFVDDAYGLEAYYSFKLYRGVYLTADVQVIDGAFADVGTTTVLGLRLSVFF
jgi:porin